MCGAPAQAALPLITRATSRRPRVWLRWILAVVICIFVIPMAIVIVIGIQEAKTSEEGSQKQIEARRIQAEAKHKFDATPEGRRAEKKRNQDELKASAQRIERTFYAKSCEDSFLDHGLDVRCAVDEDKRELMITGPTVNRVFAHQFFMAHNAVKALKAAGFTGVYFSNDKSGFSSEFFSQEFDLTR